MTDEASDLGIVPLLEAALMEYVERYGLTDAARLVLSRLGGGTSVGSDRATLSRLF